MARSSAARVSDWALTAWLPSMPTTMTTAKVHASLPAIRFIECLLSFLDEQWLSSTHYQRLQGAMMTEALYS
jgi:hypothetical protein